MGYDITTLQDQSQTIGKGDLPGHPFRGNQYTSGEGGGKTEDKGKPKGEGEGKPRGPLDMVSGIMEYEAGEMDEERQVEFFQQLLDTGAIYGLQGSYQREAQRMLDSGLIHRPSGPRSGSEGQGSITLDRTSLKELKGMYEEAKAAGKQTFNYKGKELVTAYAKYLIEYAGSRLDRGR